MQAGSSTRTARWLAFAAAALAAVCLAPAAAAVTIIDGIPSGLPDYDSRTGVQEPTAAQRQQVAALGASATWNRFGTPHTLIKNGGFLATGVSGATAEAAARTFLAANRELFRLQDVSTLVLHGDSKLAGSRGHAVTLRQKFGQLDAWPEGIVTVGLTGTPSAGWKVASVSSTLTGATALSGAPQLSLKEAWVRAALNTGLAVPLPQVGASTGVQGGYEVFSVAGLDENQLARPLAFVTPSGVVPAVEALVLGSHVAEAGAPGGHEHGHEHGHAGGAYSIFIDSRNGKVLMRSNLVENLEPEDATPFSGTLPATDGGCVDTSYTVSGAGVKSLDVVATADNPANDIYVDLLRAGNVVAHGDSGTSPELIHYAPAGDVPAGAYVVRVCDYGDGAGPLPPTTFTGVIVENDVANVSATAYPPLWKAFPSTPPLNQLAQAPWNNPSTDTRKLWCWEKNWNGGTIANCDEEVKNLAARAPWDYDPKTNQPTFTTRGNNAIDTESWTDPLAPGPTGFSPVAADRNYSFPWTNQWNTAKCSPATFVPTQGNDISAALANLFAMHNRMHDWSYHLGFTEENWNMQSSNFGNVAPPPAGVPGAQPGGENDPVLGQAQAGALTGGSPSFLGRDNANMRPLPDGVSPITNMYLWQPLAAGLYVPCLDGDYDMGVIGHEYGHAIENRMIGKGWVRSGHHAGAMGESNGDLMGMEVTNEFGYVPAYGENPYAVGVFDTANPARGIRNFGMNYPGSGAAPAPSTSPMVNPLNFSAHGYDVTGPQVHADGEIWSKVNFSIRQALVAKYNGGFPASNTSLQKRCANGIVPSDLCPGNRRWMQIAFDAFLLMPVGPSMLQARDAYLAADLMRANDPTISWPSNQNELWLEFARHGMGDRAYSTNGMAAGDRDPIADFDSRNHSNEATVTFQAVAPDEANIPVHSRIHVGWFERAPIADTDPTTPSSAPPAGAAENLDNVARFVPGTYEFVARANGYGHVRFRLTLGAGQNATVRLSFPTNWASRYNGASATGDGVRHLELIDDTEATNWERTQPHDPVTGTQPDVAGSQVTVDLAGTQARTINRVQVSAMLLAGQNRFSALRQFEILTCVASALNAACTLPTGWTSRYISPANAFPGSTPRPVAPELILRSFNIPSTQATHVRIRVLTNQCTGNGQFQGEQDDDPNNATDCRGGSFPYGTGAEVPVAGPVALGRAPQRGNVRIAELQVFGRAGGTGSSEPPAPKDPVVLLTASGPLTAGPGATATYTVEYTNLGPEAASTARLTDVMPEGTALVTASPGYSVAGGTVTWSLGDVQVGETGSKSVTVKVASTAAIGSVLMNTAEFTAPLTVASPAVATTLVVP